MSVLPVFERAWGVLLCCWRRAIHSQWRLHGYSFLQSIGYPNFPPEPRRKLFSAIPLLPFLQLFIASQSISLCSKGSLTQKNIRTKNSPDSSSTSHSSLLSDFFRIQSGQTLVSAVHLSWHRAAVNCGGKVCLCEAEFEDAKHSSTVPAMCSISLPNRVKQQSWKEARWNKETTLHHLWSFELVIEEHPYAEKCYPQ